MNTTTTKAGELACPKCGKSHHIFNNAPSYKVRYAPCGQAYKLENENGVAVPARPCSIEIARHPGQCPGSGVAPATAHRDGCAGLALQPQSGKD